MIDELEAVRTVGAHEAAPDAGARARVRERVIGTGRQAPVPRRERRFLSRVLVPAAALLAVAALVVVLGARSTEEKRAASGVDRVTAPAVEPPSLFPAADEFLYVKSRGAYMDCSAAAGSGAMTCERGIEQVREAWVSATHDGKVVYSPEAGGRQSSGLGPSKFYVGNRRFTHDELAAYAPTGQELLRELRDGRQEGQGGDDPLYPFTQLTDALREAAMPPAVRRAIIAAMALVPGIEALGAVTDSEGRSGIGFAVGPGRVVTVDPVSLVMLEERDGLVNAEQAPGAGFEPGDKVSGSVYLERAVVMEAGQRP